MGLVEALFKLVSKTGIIALRNRTEASVSSESKDHKAPPTAEQNALRIGGLAFASSLTTTVVTETGNGSLPLSWKDRWEERAEPSASIAGSLVSLVRRVGTDDTTSGDVVEAGGTDCNMVYRAMRWSGPVVFPAFGRLSISTTAVFKSSYFSAFLEMIILNSSVAFDRTTILLDLEQFRIGVRTRLNTSCGKEEGYARKNSQITREPLVRKRYGIPYT